MCGLFLALDLGIKILDTLKLFTSSILSWILFPSWSKLAWLIGIPMFPLGSFQWTIYDIVRIQIAHSTFCAGNSIFIRVACYRCACCREWLEEGYKFYMYLPFCEILIQMILLVILMYAWWGLSSLELLGGKQIEKLACFGRRQNHPYRSSYDWRLDALKGTTRQPQPMLLS